MYDAMFAAFEFDALGFDTHDISNLEYGALTNEVKASGSYTMPRLQEPSNKMRDDVCVKTRIGVQADPATGTPLGAGEATRLLSCGLVGIETSVPHSQPLSHLIPLVIQETEQQPSMTAALFSRHTDPIVSTLSASYLTVGVLEIEKIALIDILLDI